MSLKQAAISYAAIQKIQPVGRYNRSNRKGLVLEGTIAVSNPLNPLGTGHL